MVQLGVLSGELVAPLGRCHLPLGLRLGSQPMLFAQGAPLTGNRWVGLLAWFPAHTWLYSDIRSCPMLWSVLFSRTGLHPQQWTGLQFAFLIRWVHKPGSMTTRLEVWAPQPDRLFTQLPGLTLLMDRAAGRVLCLGAVISEEVRWAMRHLTSYRAGSCIQF